MKVYHFIIALLLSGTIATSNAQTMRYFEIKIDACGHGNWQDTSFIVATSDTALIDTVLAEIQKPVAQRRFVSGKLAPGHGGFNHNGSHWFKWHFIPDQWALVDLAIEVCDGCPYTDVDSDTSYWIRTIGQYCPWHGLPERETTTVGIEKVNPIHLKLFPNPSGDYVELNLPRLASYHLVITDPLGRTVLEDDFTAAQKTVQLNRLGKKGVYFVYVTDADGRVSASQKLVFN